MQYFTKIQYVNLLHLLVIIPAIFLAISPKLLGGYKEVHQALVIGVYASPKVARRAVNNYLAERLLTCEGTIIVIGDFNVDLSKRRLQFHALQGMTQHIKSPTTDYNTVLDHIYSNITSVETGVFESYHSDNKPIWIKIKK